MPFPLLQRRESPRSTSYIPRCRVFRWQVNYKEAVRWYEKSAELGDKAAMFNLGRIYRYGYLGKVDSKKAKIWYEKSAEAGFVDAMTGLANMHYHGEIEGASREECVKWYKRAADAGDAESMLWMGILCESGYIEGMDDIQADQWYLKAAECGNTAAMNSVGINCLRQGKYEEALLWFGKMIDNGEVELGRIHIRRMVEKGEITPEEAAKWLE